MYLRDRERVNSSAGDISRYLIYAFIVMTIIYVSKAQGELSIRLLSALRMYMYCKCVKEPV